MSNAKHTTERKPVINYIDLYSGRCGLTVERRSEVLRRLGTDNVRSVRPATEDEVLGVEAMGGHVPSQGRIAKGIREKP